MVTPASAVFRVSRTPEIPVRQFYDTHVLRRTHINEENDSGLLRIVADDIGLLAADRVAVAVRVIKVERIPETSRDAKREGLHR